ncbi:hypothetical protein ACS0TY_014321 [Phlomoides rotata]
MIKKNPRRVSRKTVAGNFDYNTCPDCIRKLYKCYEVFKFIIEHDGVEHNELNHTVAASQDTWDAIFLTG